MKPEILSEISKQQVLYAVVKPQITDDPVNIYEMVLVATFAESKDAIEFKNKLLYPSQYQIVPLSDGMKYRL